MRGLFLAASLFLFPPLLWAAPKKRVEKKWKLPGGARLTVAKPNGTSVLETSIRGRKIVLRLGLSTAWRGKQISLKGHGRGFSFSYGGDKCRAPVVSLDVVGSLKRDRRAKEEYLLAHKAVLQGSALCDSGKRVTVKLLFPGVWR